MAERKLSADGRSAILDALSGSDLAPDTRDDLLKQFGKIVSDFRARLGPRSRQADLAWYDRTAKVVRQLRSELALSRCPSRVRLALHKDITRVSRPLARIEQQLKDFAKAARAQMPTNRPPDTIKDDLAEQVGSWLIRARIPVVSTPEKVFVALNEILWKEISGSDDVNFTRHAYRALNSLKKNHPQYFTKKRRSNDAA